MIYLGGEGVDKNSFPQLAPGGADAQPVLRHTDQSLERHTSCSCSSTWNKHPDAPQGCFPECMGAVRAISFGTA